MNNYEIEKKNCIVLLNHIDEQINKITNYNFWNFKVNKNIIFNNFKYSCVFYVLTHYIVFNFEICQNYNCYYCNTKATRVIFDYNTRTKMILDFLDNIDNDFIYFSDILIFYLIKLKIKSRELFFCCENCKNNDFPSYKNITNSEELIIDIAFQLRDNNINKKWKNHKIKFDGLKIIKC